MKKLIQGKRAVVQQGFTLVELVLVIVLLGVISVGISGFIGLSTQAYVNVSERDELVSNARFVIERLNRELRNAVPNSVRVTDLSGIQCMDFVPISASTIYTNIPVAPETASNQITVIPFKAEDGVNDYSCSSCLDLVIVYPNSTASIYDNHNDTTGRVFNLADFTPPTTLTNEWTLSIANGAVLFDQDSPTQRLYIANEQVSYCVFANKMYRYRNNIGGSQTLPPRARPTLMAEYLADIDNADLPFTILPATLQRNAVVQIKLHFLRNNENIVFENEVQIKNTL